MKPYPVLQTCGITAILRQSGVDKQTAIDSFITLKLRLSFQIGRTVFSWYDHRAKTKRRQGLFLEKQPWTPVRHLLALNLLPMFCFLVSSGAGGFRRLLFFTTKHHTSEHYTESSLARSTLCSYVDWESSNLASTANGRPPRPFMLGFVIDENQPHYLNLDVVLFIYANRELHLF
ncbi:MAG: hypothetical protein R2911_33760 [Caldilineaceae bacterium]